MKKENIKYRVIGFILILVIGVIFSKASVLAEPADPIPSSNLVIKIGDGAGYEDGDVVVAMNAKSTLFAEAEQLTHPDKMPRRANGTIKEGSLLEDFYEKTREYKFERISSTEVRRIRRFVSDSSTDPITYIPANDIDILSDVPNKKGEFIDIPLFIKKNKEIIFGIEGREYWYGGETKITDQTMDSVWDKIEERTSQKRNYDFPFSEQEKRSFAVLKVQNMTDREVKELTKSLVDVEGKIIKKRVNKIDMSKVGLSSKEMTDLKNKNKSHEFRNRRLNIDAIKNVKTN